MAGEKYNGKGVEQMKKVFGMSVLILSVFAVLTVVSLAAPACFDIITGCVDIGSTYRGSDFVCNDSYCLGDPDGPDCEYAYYCEEWYCSGVYKYNRRKLLTFCGSYCSSIK